MKDCKINGESSVWSAAEIQEKIYGFDVQVKGKHISVGYGK